MDGRYAFLFEFLVFSGPVLAWCAWELYALKRDKAQRDTAASADAGHAEGK
jgi:hypothetical protein